MAGNGHEDRSKAKQERIEVDFDDLATLLSCKDAGGESSSHLKRDAEIGVIALYNHVY